MTVVIVGAGAAGITVAAGLRRRQPALSVILIDPAATHYYQPAFTLVGAGVYDFERTQRAQADLIPAGAEWLRDRVVGFQPEQQTLALAAGPQVHYDHLVLCPGIQLDWDKVAGLREALGRNGVCSNYSPDHVTYTWDCLRSFGGGAALFTQPPVPIKCAGAPQKIAYLAADYWRRRGVMAHAHLHFLSAAATLFSVPYFSSALEKVAARHGIQILLQHNLVAVNGAKRIATFERTGRDGAKERLEMEFEMLHATPPQSAPDFIKQSPFANAAGWVDVNPNTLQHVKYANVFSLGDASSAPTSKTAAAIRKQAPVVVNNILAMAAGRSPSPGYDGYTSCPLTTSLNTVMLAEFSYDGRVTPTFPLRPDRERLIWWLLKKYGLPRLYWDYMLKGHEWDIPHRPYPPS
ncbi:MAG TPA: FAD/NAD(P)-binding oxidoreductase [Gammaproteobacteria bacterium]|nr:FAD/NAD(P)-binding oxidoreductase [Gammaproteobacteria bacterium]